MHVHEARWLYGAIVTAIDLVQSVNIVLVV